MFNYFVCKMNDYLFNTPKICRTCLVEIKEDSDVFQLDSIHSNHSIITLKHKLKTCVKDLNLKITPNAVICGDCYISVNFIYKFWKQCMQTEEYISSYLQNMGSSSSIGDLMQVVQQIKDNTSKHLACNVIKLEYNEPPVEIHGIQDLSIVDTSKITFNSTEENSLNNLENISDVDPTKFIGPNIPDIAADSQNNEQHSTPPNIFKCFHCSYSVTRKSTLSHHIHSKHGHEATLSSTQKRKYRCPACAHTFKSMQWLNSKPFRCKNCKYSSTNISNLENIKNSVKEHHRKHKNSCKCTKCNYQAAVRNLLKSHHTGAYKKFQILACKLFKEAYDVIK